MNQTDNNETEYLVNTRPGLLVFATIILALSALSFHGALDRFAAVRVKDTTIETIGIYAITKAINAGVSVLQSAEVGVGVASVNPGEILDPLNDASERLSGILVWAIGSLFMQQILLEVTASPAFKWLFAGVGLITLFMLLPLCSDRLSERASKISGISREILDRSCRGAIRAFVIIAVLRFIVPVFIACSFLVSEMLVQSHLEKNAEELKVLSNEISAKSDTTPPEKEELAEQKKEKLKDLAKLQKSEADYQKQLDGVNSKIKLYKEEARNGKNLLERLGGQASDSKLDALKEKSAGLERKLGDSEQQVETVKSDIECIDRIMKGKKCGSMLERLNPVEMVAGLADLNPMDKIASLARSINDYLVSMARILVALLIKNILFPLLFFYIAMKCSIHIIRRGIPLLKNGMDTKLELQEEIKKLKRT